jgi:integrase
MIVVPRAPKLPIPTRTDWHKSESSDCWSLTLGERGSRVRVFQETAGGVFYREMWIPGRGRSKISLRTTSRTEARARAEAFLRAVLDAGMPRQRAPLTLGELWTRYQQECPAYRDNAETTRADKIARAELLLLAFGKDMPVEMLALADVERYSETRRRGTGWPDGHTTEPVRARSVAADLQLLRTMIRWATTVRLPDRSWLLAENPLRGLTLPTEPNPKRPVATFDRFVIVRDAVRALAVEAATDLRYRWLRLELALVLVEATGRRIGSVAALRWEDVQQDPPAIRWRAEHDKKGRDAVIPIPVELLNEIRRLRAQLGAFADGYVFADRKGGHWSTDLLAQLLRQAEQRAKVPKQRGGAWHPYRRKWATERKALPIADVKEAGGWKDTATLLTCYQQPDEHTLLAVVSSPNKLVGRKLAENA